MSADLTGRVVIVTGAFGALGEAVTLELVACGAHVLAVDFASSPPKTWGAHCTAYSGVDLTKEDSATALMQRAERDAGKIDALVNIAGGFTWEKLEGGALATWEAMFRVNLATVVSATKAVLPFLARAGYGRIVNIGALGAVKASVGMGSYAASKAGVAKLTEALAEEVKDRGITVNALLPSIIDTPRNRHDMPDADFSRWVAPSKVAKVIAFLLSAEADAVTGALIPVSGRV